MTFSKALRSNVSVSLLSLGLATLLSSCSSKFDDCKETATCTTGGAGGKGGAASGGKGGASATGGTSTTGGNGGASTGGAATCSPACAPSSSTPICLNTTCVGCTEASQCKDAALARCDTATHSCTTCSGNADCKHLSGAPVCDGGKCVECTPETEATDCGANACSPKTHTCTTRARQSRAVCQSCETDSECVGGDIVEKAKATARCMELSFGGKSRGGYCLTRQTAGCAKPYDVTKDAASISGAASESYCSINEELTTCEAVKNMIDSVECSAVGKDSECGCDAATDPSCVSTVSGVGGLCRKLALGNICTIPCNGAGECMSGRSCFTPPAAPPQYCE